MNKTTEKKKKDRDAVSSWSGFNFQGKMTLLYILEYINNMIKEEKENLSDYTFEIEKKEDLIIYKENKVKVICQMKARLSVSKTYNAHKDACKMLKKTKKDLAKDEKNVKLILMSALEINNWNDGKNPFKKDIEKYTYLDNGEKVQVGVSDVPKYLKKEIIKWCQLREELYEIDLSNKQYLEDLYYALCNFLDEKIAYFHEKGKMLDYNISLVDIDELLGGKISDIKTTKEMIQREQLYKHLAMVFDEGAKEMCEECKEDSKEEEYCKQDCGINIYFENLEKIKLIDHIKVINPNLKWNDIMNDLSTQRNKDEHKENILLVYQQSGILNIKDSIEISNNIKTVGIKNRFEDQMLEKFKFIIPTLIDNPASIKRPDRNKKSIQKILEAIRNNTEISPYIDKNILLGRIKANKLLSLNESITNFPDLEEGCNEHLNLEDMDIAIVDIEYYWENEDKIEEVK